MGLKAGATISLHGKGLLAAGQDAGWKKKAGMLHGGRSHIFFPIVPARQDHEEDHGAREQDRHANPQNEEKEKEN